MRLPHASFNETFAVQGGGEGERDVVLNDIEAQSASIYGNITAGTQLCVGSVCVDTVAFGQMVRTSAQIKSIDMQSLATAVFMVNSMLGNTTLLPNQSVISLTYVGGDYAKMTNADPTGASTASFAQTIATGVRSALPLGSIGAASTTATFLTGLANTPVPSDILGTYGITGVTGADVTNQVAAQLAVFSTWSDIMSTPSTSTSSSTAAASMPTSVYTVSVTEGSIVVNLLITYNLN